MRRLLKRWYRRLRDRRTRRSLVAPTAAERVVLTSTWDFPNPTHGYAYQEMLGFLARGYDVRVFCGEPRPHNGLAARFRPLLSRTAVVETLRDLHLADRAWLEREHPGRIDAFLARVAAATGRELTELRDDPLVLRAATFTRLVALTRARYLQSWFFYDQSFMAMYAAQVLGLPRAISCHVDHVLADHPLKLVPLQLATADLVLAISERTRAELVALGGPGCRERILLKRIGVDGTAFRPWRDRPALGGSFTLISLCRIEPKKGLLELLEACALLRQRGRELRLRLIGGADPGHAGSADYAAAVRARVAELGLAGVVALEGAMASDDIPAAFGAAHGFVAPYVEVADGDKDGIPTAMVEAMAAGLPIVCTDAGAMREAVADGVEGLVVAQRDPVALAAAIGRLQDDAALRQRLGNAAAIRFDREFDCRITDEELHRRVREFVARSASGA